MRPRLVVVLAIALQPLIWLGFGKRYPWAAFGLESLGGWLWTVVTLAYFIGAAAIARRLTWSGGVEARLERLAAFLLLACPPLTLALDFAAARYFARFGYQTPWLMVPLEIVVLLALALWIKAGRPLGRGVWIAAIGATAHRVLAIQAFPYHPSRSDMLHLIREGVQLAGAGGSPYVIQPQSAVLGVYPHLSYLPGAWLVHWPTVALGIDMRWLGTAILFALGIWIALRVRSRTTELLAVLVILSPYHAYRHELYFEAFLVLTLTLFLLVARRDQQSPAGLLGIAALTGVAIVTREWAWIYAPFILLAAASVPGVGGGAMVRRLALASLVAVAVAALVALPWALRDPTFVSRILSAQFVRQASDLTFGLSWAGQRLGLVSLLRPAQAVLCLGAFAWAFARAWKGQLSPSAIAATAWLVWVAVVALNPVLENYFYLSPSFAAVGLALALTESEFAPRPGELATNA